jgi:hypothetical protein
MAIHATTRSRRPLSSSRDCDPQEQRPVAVHDGQPDKQLAPASRVRSKQGFLDPDARSRASRPARQPVAPSPRHGRHMSCTTPAPSGLRCGPRSAHRQHRRRRVVDVGQADQQLAHARRVELHRDSAIRLASGTTRFVESLCHVPRTLTPPRSDPKSPNRSGTPSLSVERPGSLTN